MKQKKQYFMPAITLVLYSEDVLMVSGTTDPGIEWNDEWNSKGNSEWMRNDY